MHAGKAALTGTVEDDVNKDLAKQIALGVSGIKNVDNQIVVRADYVPPKASAERSFGDVVDDAYITAAVKSKLLWSKHTDGIVTDVDTKYGKVTLSGTADTAEAKELAGRHGNRCTVVGVDNQLVDERCEGNYSRVEHQERRQERGKLGHVRRLDHDKGEVHLHVFQQC